ncbi:MAG TPA: hypothetical protein VFF90_01065, partial [Saprospiraceae bacterium]|nr:hypothetical protein [Saprospiraceae bacterium]
LLAYNDELYVGGVFVSAGGNSNAHDVVKWDGEDWLHIGATLGGFLGLHALTIFNGSLYTTVGAGWASDDGIYRWDFGAETWDAFQIMELGADDPLFVLSTEGSNMYAGGYSGMVIEGESYAGLGRWGELSYPGIVTSAEDHGPGSLREIIACASNGDIITFMLPPLSQINLTSGEIIIDKDLTLSGPGVDELTISGNNQSRIFNLLAGKNFTVTGLSLKNAMAFLNGGAIYVKGNLNLEDVLLQNNFENTIPRGLTLISPGIFTSAGIVEIKY